MTMLVATHEMSFARQVADRVCFLSGGRILEQGPPEAIFDHPREPRTKEFLARQVDDPDGQDWFETRSPAATVIIEIRRLRY